MSTRLDLIAAFEPKMAHGLKTLLVTMSRDPWWLRAVQAMETNNRVALVRTLKDYVVAEWMQVVWRRRSLLSKESFNPLQRQLTWIREFQSHDLKPLLCKTFLVKHLQKKVMSKSTTRVRRLDAFEDIIFNPGRLFSTESWLRAPLRKFWLDRWSPTEEVSYIELYFSMSKMLVASLPTEEDWAPDDSGDEIDPELEEAQERRMATRAAYFNFLQAWAESDVHEMLVYVDLSKLPPEFKIPAAVVVMRNIYPRDSFSIKGEWIHAFFYSYIFDFWFTADPIRQRQANPSQSRQEDMPDLLERIFTPSLVASEEPVPLLQILVRLSEVFELDELKALVDLEKSGRRRFRHVEFDPEKKWWVFSRKHPSGKRVGILFLPSSLDPFSPMDIFVSFFKSPSLFHDLLLTMTEIDATESQKRVEQSAIGDWALCPPDMQNFLSSVSRVLPPYISRSIDLDKPAGWEIFKAIANAAAATATSKKPQETKK